MFGRAKLEDVTYWKDAYDNQSKKYWDLYKNLDNLRVDYAVLKREKDALKTKFCKIEEIIHGPKTPC